MSYTPEVTEYAESIIDVLSEEEFDLYSESVKNYIQRVLPAIIFGFFCILAFLCWLDFCAFCLIDYFCDCGCCKTKGCCQGLAIIFAFLSFIIVLISCFVVIFVSL